MWSGHIYGSPIHISYTLLSVKVILVAPEQEFGIVMTHCHGRDLYLFSFPVRFATALYNTHPLSANYHFFSYTCGGTLKWRLHIPEMNADLLSHQTTRFPATAYMASSKTQRRRPSFSWPAVLSAQSPICIYACSRWRRTISDKTPTSRSSAAISVQSAKSTKRRVC